MSIRIESCTIDGFGPLVDLELAQLDHPVVVLEGRNEAGKTAFFHFLQTMFYGIYPTDAAKHPYTPRDGRQLEGALTFRSRDGARFTVARRLLSRPQAQLHRADGDSDRLGNRTLPVVRHIPQSVYTSVYALQLDDMVQIEGDAWDEIQDRLLGTLSVEHLRPAREVIAELEDEATDLWRTDNRGKPEAKQLEQRRSELREAAREARERDDEVRRLRDEIAEHGRRIEESSDEQVALRAKQRRAERLVPVRSLLQQIERFDERAGDLSPYEDLPDDPEERLEEIEQEISEVEEVLEEKRATAEDLEAALEAYSDADEAVLEHADAIRAWGRRVERHEKQVVDLKAARREADDARRRLEGAASVLTDDWTEDLAPLVRELSLTDLRERIKAYERAERDLSETQARAETVGLHVQARKSLAPWVAVTLVGMVGVVLGLIGLVPANWVSVASGAVAAVGLLQAVAVWRHNRQLEFQQAHVNLDEKRREAQQRAEDVQELLTDLPVPGHRLEQPDMDLFADLTALTEALRERDEAVASVREQVEELDEAEQDLRTLARDCGLADEEADRSVAAVVAALENRLQKAETHCERATDAEDRLPSIRSECGELEAERKNLREQRESIRARLSELGDGDLDAGVDELDARRTAAHRAKMSRDRLHAEYPDWEEYRDEIEELEADGGWSFTDEERARIEKRIQDLENEIRAEEKERTGKEKDVEHLLQQRTVGDIESELAHVERRLEEIRAQRDRRMLLAGIVSRADAEFRRKHQPDVLRRASEFLANVTHGRYQRLSVDEQEDRLVVFETEDGFPRAVGPPLSQGTLDQIYLSLRLAIIDHLDAESERLPVFLDEVFVNWDPDRREAAFDLLREMAEERQLFFFTCHPHFAREAAERLDARHLNLSSGRGVTENRDPTSEVSATD